MSELLETMMLVCFGLSWPISVYKNFKLRTAKGMSLSFTMLITFGYLAGISAKILTDNINFVLVVYFINLFMVGLNIIIYFINRHYDKAKEGKYHSIIESIA